MQRKMGFYQVRIAAHAVRFAMTAPGPSVFFPTKADRLALARERYFHEGQLPTGVVSEAVFHSWARCQRLHVDPAGGVTFQPVSPSRTHLALQKNRSLHTAWLEELPNLQAVLGTTTCAAMLTDASGVLIGATCVGRSHERLMPVVTRLGVNLSEEAVGTTAPGVAARTGQAVSVMGAEHFFEDVKAMHCAAAPIRDTQGRLAGVLDLSSEVLPFAFDAAAVVGLYAGAIENRLLVNQASEHLVIRFQVDPSLLDSPVAALIGIASNGEVAWRNGTASRLLGVSSEPEIRATGAEALLGATVSQLASLPGSAAALLRLPNGLLVWARSQMRAPDGHRVVIGPQGSAGSAGDLAAEAKPPRTPVPPVPAESPASAVRLRDSDRTLIERTVKECGGNVSQAAARLGVSRGLVYRRLRGV